MKVGQLYEAAQIDATSRVGTRPAGGNVGGTSAAATSPVPAETDKVQISARSLANQDHDTVNLARAADLQKAIAEGRYPIDPRKIAQTMISQAAELVETLASRGGAQ